MGSLPIQRGDKGTDADFPDPLAPLRSLPELSFGVHTHRRGFAMDALRSDRTLKDDAERSPKVNAHVHVPPNFSAFETVEQAVERASEAGLAVLGANNYYDFSIYARFAHCARTQGIFPLFGVEIISLEEELKKAGIKVNDPDNPGRMYVCGKGISHFAPMGIEAKSLMERIRDADSARMSALTEATAAIFKSRGISTDITAASVQSMLARRYAVPLTTVYLQERHVAQAFQEALFASFPRKERAGMLQTVLGGKCTTPNDPVAVQNQIRSHLMKAGKPAYVEDSVIDTDDAHALVLGLGGIPCYPILADGASPVCAFENSVDGLVDALIARGIWCAELIPSRNDPSTVDRYANALRDKGIIIVGGTEHNTLEMVPMTPECKGHVPVSIRVAQLFWEGACVVAAHQYLSARGQTGYVDARGNLHSGFTTQEERIGELSHLGSMVIDAFRRANEDRGANVAPTNTKRSVEARQP
jgi:hypothetical protein